MKLVFQPYKYSEGLKLICEKLREMGHKVVQCKANNSNYRIKRNDSVFQWGVSSGGKLNQYRLFNTHGVRIAAHTTDRRQAEEWVANGSRVLCRTRLNGHGGDGIVVVDGLSVDNIVDAPLYVKYVPKKREFRVHTFNGNFYVTEKKRMAVERRPENFNKYIRNHSNGWVFCREMEPVPEAVLLQAEAAVNALNLVFGAVDVGWHPEHGVCVYEVNTAPGCDNETALWYANNFVRPSNEN